MYLSTRGGDKVSASEAIINGIAKDGGLYVPEKIKKINIDKEYVNKDFLDISKDVLKIFFDDFTDEEINEVISLSYNKHNFRKMFLNIKDFNNSCFLELYHGPTLAFKDMALTMLPYLINIAKRKIKDKSKLIILVATSGDTGSAALSSFKNAELFDTIVIYPNNGVSIIQEKQMLFNSNYRTKAFSYNGNFDDCQNLVKKIFNNYDNRNKIKLSSANSINIGRLIPQVIYYVFAYCQLVKTGKIQLGEKINIAVPTGNFGDIFAGYLASLIGVNIEKFLCASNINNVLTDFFQTGIYNINRKFYKTNSPSMDILISSNLERLLYYASDCNTQAVKKYMQDLKDNGCFSIDDKIKINLNNFDFGFTDEESTMKSINECFNNYNYLIDPHTAVAYNCYREKSYNNYTVIVSTASPLKFPNTIAKSIGIYNGETEEELVKKIASFIEINVPSQLEEVLYTNKEKEIIDEIKLIDILSLNNNKVFIKVPCTSANLGVGFDCIGLAFNLFNSYLFEKNVNDDLINFNNIKNEDNLVLKTYKYYFKKYKIKYIPIKITQTENNIPVSRGLGSSAACIIAGVMAADYFTNHIKTQEELIDLMIEIEGHSDNILPAYFGGLVSSYFIDKRVKEIKHCVNENLRFYALIPELMLSTEKARNVLPKKYEMCDIVHNISRAINLPLAFYSGNIEMIKDVFDDKLHQIYRFPLIDDSLSIKEMLESMGYAVALSGSGSTLLVVGNECSKDFKINIDELRYRWKKEELKINREGVYIKYE